MIKKRLTSFLMMFIMVLSMIVIPSATASAAEVYYAGETLNTKNESNRQPIMRMGGYVDYDNFAPMQTSWTNPSNGVIYQAYCVNPAYPGYGDIEEYTVDIMRFDNDSIVDAGGSGGAGKTPNSTSMAGNSVSDALAGAVTYGFPTVDAATLLKGSASAYGVTQDQLDYAAYLATKMAIWSLIHNSYSIGLWNQNPDASYYPYALREAVVEATKDIYNKAGSYTTPAVTTQITFVAGEGARVAGNWEVVYTINPSSSVLTGHDMFISMRDSSSFGNLKICDMSGNEYPLDTSGAYPRYKIPSGTTSIKAVVPMPTGEETVTKDITVYALTQSKILLYGKSNNPVAQNYILAGNAYATSSDDFTVGAQSLNPEPLPEGDISIKIEKYDEQTGAKLPNAQFAIYEQADTSRPIAEGMTDKNGVLLVSNVDPGTYVIRELNPPPGYMVSDKTSPDRLIIAKTGDGVITVKVDNIKLPELQIKKQDLKTKDPIQGVTYEVKKVDGASVGTYVTDAQGKISIPGLEAGAYVVTEISAPEPYIINSTPQNVSLVGGDNKTLLFENIKYPTLIVQKTDGTTYKGIPNTTFKIEYEENGGKVLIGTFKTGADGRITLPFVKSGWYVVTETIPAQGYQKPTNPVTRIYLNAGDNSYLSTSNTVDSNSTNNNNISNTAGTYTITSGADYEVVGDIVNYPLNSIVIKKSDANTGEMLDGAIFEVIKTTGETSGQNGTLICTVTTDHSGVIVITGLEAGAYAIREIKAPTNYIIAETNLQTVNLKADGTSVVEVVFRNYPYGHILITKVDASNNAPLAGATFKITKGDGTVVGNSNGIYVTNSDGEILVSNLEPGSYVITETIAPDGYVIDTTPQTIKVGTDGGTYKVSFQNQPDGGLVIKKYDYNTKEPLAGAQFKITDSKGAVVGTSNGIYTTDASGTIHIPNLKKGTYIVQEIKAPEGYILENQSQTIEIGNSKTYTLDFYNKIKSGLQIIKIDSETKEPLKDAKFTVYKKNGEIIGQYETNGDGIVILDNLEPGWYKIAETKAPDGYILDDIPQDVEVTYNQFIKVVFENKPFAELVIIKTDSKTDKPLEGVKFEVAKINGEKIGTFTTDRKGYIHVNNLMSGKYTVTEVKALDGYELDNTVHEVEIKNGKQVKLEIENNPLAGLRLIKIDSITGEGIYNVEFMIFDRNNKVVGTFYTDNRGVIDLDEGILPAGTYKIRETRPAEGYYRDDVPRTIKMTTGKTTEIVWENVPEAGQIQIHKTSGDLNEYNGLPEGTALQGAIFEVYNHKTGRVVDRFVTDYYGYGVSKPLPLGRYIVKEVQAPSYYKINPTAIDVTIEFATQIVKVEVKNYSANTGVTIDKVGPKEVVQGSSIRYDIKNVRNVSTVALTDFFWRDVIPTNAVTLEKIVTGTYSQSVKYKIMITTNKGNVRTIADNLMTTKNNVVDCSAASLGLPSDEYVVSFALMFGTVQPGFTMVEDAKVYVKVKSTGLPNGYQFANKADIGGKYQGEWVVGNATTVATVYNPTQDRLPKTGW